jgi:hypothetical protein
MTPCPAIPLISIVDDNLSVRRALRRLVPSASDVAGGQLPLDAIEPAVRPERGRRS